MFTAAAHSMRSNIARRQLLASINNKFASSEAFHIVQTYRVAVGRWHRNVYTSNVAR